ncbi:unnamed protein product, partial [Onchocerca ochengi]|uniref:Reverse transcriptase domain-containing protein n=1 Tax=Onchocerca ochengi TaxID=42157 RepID=A0A182EUA2_ONCOC
MHYVRTFLIEEIDRIYLLREEESRNEGPDVKSVAKEKEGGESLIELIEKMVTTSKPPEIKITNPQKTTTQLRVVFDASAKTTEGPSLNGCLYRGPVMLPSLVGIILRARQAHYIIMADAEKAFLQ